jgi:hypothetical protein
MVWSEESGGGFSLVEHPIPPRPLATPLHRHANEDEYSYVFEGRMGAQLGAAPASRRRTTSLRTTSLRGLRPEAATLSQATSSGLVGPMTITVSLGRSSDGSLRKLWRASHCPKSSGCAGAG